MNLDEIKKKLNQFQKQPKQSNEEQKQLMWKPTVGKQTIRIVPSKFNEDSPFTEMFFYYNIGEKKMMPSLKIWGQKDPISEFVKELRKGNDKEGWRLAKSLEPKIRIFAPIIVRGEEDKGVRLWQFGKKTYEMFLQMAMDEEVGDYSDVNQGRDIKLNTVGPESTGTMYNETTISPSMKNSSLSDDAALVKEWLDNQPNVKEMFKPFEYDVMKDELRKHIEAEEDKQSKMVDIDESPFHNTPEPTPKTTKKSSKLDNLFDEE